MRTLRRLVCAATLLALSAPAAQAEDVKTFYTGKTIKLLVGLPPGGGADAYARLVQRHLGRFVPGTPQIVAQNMPGAGTLRSVMALNSSPDDGTAMVHFSSALLTEAITSPDKVKLDFRTFSFIGNVSEDVRVCYVRSATGIKTWNDMLAASLVVFGATAPGTAGNVDTAMLRNLFGVKLKQVQGYAGSADKRLAIERGEIDGDCGGWTSVPEEWLRDGRISVVIRLSPTLVAGHGQERVVGRRPDQDPERPPGLRLPGRARAARPPVHDVRQGPAGSRGGAAHGLRRHGRRRRVPGRRREDEAPGHADDR